MEGSMVHWHGAWRGCAACASLPIARMAEAWARPHTCCLPRQSSHTPSIALVLLPLSFIVRNIVDASAIRDIQDSCVYEGGCCQGLHEGDENRVCLRARDGGGG